MISKYFLCKNCLNIYEITEKGNTGKCLKCEKNQKHIRKYKKVFNVTLFPIGRTAIKKYDRTI